MGKVLIVLALAASLGLLALGDSASNGEGGAAMPRLGALTATPNGVPSCAGAPVEPGGAAVIDNVWVDPSIQAAWCETYTNPTPTGGSVQAETVETVSSTPTPNGVPSCAPPPVEPGGSAIIDNVWVEPSVQAAWCESFTNPTPTGGAAHAR